MAKPGASEFIPAKTDVVQHSLLRGSSSSISTCFPHRSNGIPQFKTDTKIKEFLPVPNLFRSANIKRARSRSRSPASRKPFLDPDIPFRSHLHTKVKQSESFYSAIPGEILASQYRVESEVGRGTYAIVLRTQHLETGDLSAIKIMRNRDDTDEIFEKETRVLKKLRSSDPRGDSWIVKITKKFNHAGYSCFAMPYYPLTLRDMLKHNQPLLLDTVRLYARQIFSALKLLRKENVVHADIKPNNILVSECMKRIAIADFGSALADGEGYITDCLVARYYRPPEIILGNVYSHSIDIWSVGCTLYQMVTGQVLFPGHTNAEMLRLIQETCGILPKKIRNQGMFSSSYFDGQYFYGHTMDSKTRQISKLPQKIKELVKLSPLWTRLPLGTPDDHDFLDLLSSCLRLDPSTRITPEQALTHPFFNNTNQMSSDQKLLFSSPSVINGDEPEANVDDFESLSRKALGEGAFGEVYRVRHKKTQEIYAIKVIRKEKVLQQGMLTQIRREIRIMYSLNHPYIIKLYNHFEDETNFYLVMELASNGNLYNRLARYKSFDERTTAQYVREVALAIEYLHNKVPPVIHRDIKPENILLDEEGRVKLCDFGWSNFFNPDRTRLTYCGTLEYLAPEMINKDGHDASLDVWNLGILMFELLAGRAPFQSKNQMELFNKILQLRINFPKNFPFPARDLIQKLLKVQPSQRINVHDALNHPWIKMQVPIRPTETQDNLVPEPLPCDPNKSLGIEEEDLEPTFSAEEYKVLTVTPSDINKNLAVPTFDTPTASLRASATKVVNTLESELSTSRKETNAVQNEIVQVVQKIKRTIKRIKELDVQIGKADFLIQNREEATKVHEQKLKALNTEIVSLQASKDQDNKLYRDYESLKSSTLEKQTEVSLLITSTTELEKFSIEKTTALEEAEDECDKLRIKLGKLRREVTIEKSQLSDELGSMQTDVEILNTQAKNSNQNQLEKVLTYTQEALDGLKKRTTSETDIMEKYQYAIDAYSELDKNYTAQKVQYDEAISQLWVKLGQEEDETKRKIELTNQPIVKNNEMIRLKKKQEEAEHDMSLNEDSLREFELINRQIERAERDISAFQKQQSDLDELIRLDSNSIQLMQGRISDIKKAINNYERKSSTRK